MVRAENVWAPCWATIVTATYGSLVCMSFNYRVPLVTSLVKCHLLDASFSINTTAPSPFYISLSLFFYYENNSKTDRDR